LKDASRTFSELALGTGPVCGALLKYITFESKFLKSNSTKDEIEADNAAWSIHSSQQIARRIRQDVVVAEDLFQSVFNPLWPVVDTVQDRHFSNP
jgi:hypothetical protein